MVDGVQGSRLTGPGSYEKLRARWETYEKKIERGEIPSPVQRDANGNIIPSEPTRRFTIKDIGLHSEAINM